MTQREAQILRWIQEDPLISQQELAARAGIARSSVAVHISNLMKKGYIEGKGYIVRTAPYVAVVGSVSMDIGGRPHRGLDPDAVNEGQVRTSLGGMGRNIAHNLRMMGVDVRLVTALGEDVAARRICHSCASLGIDLSHSIRVPDGVTASCVYITDPQGHPALAVADGEIYRHLTPEWLSARQELLDGAQLVIMDACLPEAALQWLAHHVRVPLFADPVDVGRAALLRPMLSRIHTLKPDLLEAQALSGVEIRDRDSLALAADRLLEAGVKQVLISLGPDGIYAADQEGECCLLPACPGVNVSTNGCGAAAVAGLAWAYLEGSGLEESARTALAAAAIARESCHTVNPDLSPELLRRRMGDGPIPEGQAV